jgi:hypothetical protein
MSDRPTEPTGQEQCTLPADLVQRLIEEARKGYALLFEAMNNVDFDVDHWRVEDDRQEGQVISAVDVYFTLASVLDEVEAATKQGEEGT